MRRAACAARVRIPSLPFAFICLPGLCGARHCRMIALLHRRHGTAFLHTSPSIAYPLCLAATWPSRCYHRAALRTGGKAGRTAGAEERAARGEETWRRRGKTAPDLPLPPARAGGGAPSRYAATRLRFANAFWRTSAAAAPLLPRWRRALLPFSLARPSGGGRWRGLLPSTSLYRNLNKACDGNGVLLWVEGHTGREWVGGAPVPPAHLPATGTVKLAANSARMTLFISLRHAAVAASRAYQHARILSAATSCLAWRRNTYTANNTEGEDSTGHRRHSCSAAYATFTYGKPGVGDVLSFHISLHLAVCLSLSIHILSVCKI